MSKIVFIKENSPEIREKLKDAGFSVCICASFEDSIWLDYSPEGNFQFDIHGIGYDSEDEWGLKHLLPKERIEEWLKMEGVITKDREFFNTVDEFLEIYGRKENYSSKL